MTPLQDYLFNVDMESHTSTYTECNTPEMPRLRLQINILNNDQNDVSRPILM